MDGAEVLAAALRPDLSLQHDPDKRQVLMYGAAGKLGETVLAGLLADSRVVSVHIVTTAPLPSSEAKLHFIEQDRLARAALPRLCSAVVVLGEGDGSAFQSSFYGRDKVFAVLEQEHLLERCQALHQRGVERLVLVAPSPAHLQSKMFDRLLAGELELQLVRWFSYLTVIRPGARMARAEGGSRLQRLGAAVLAQLSMMVPAHTLTSDPKQVAALVRAALIRRVAGVEVVGSLAATTLQQATGPGAVKERRP